MRKPSCIQLLFAKSWFSYLLFLGGSVGVGATYIMWTHPDQAESSGVIVMGAFIGTFAGIATFTGLMRFRAWMNGAPFHIGDHVQTLAGKHKGKVVRVYEEWPDRKQVLVNLGDQAKRDVENVFSEFELCRESRTEPLSPPSE